MRVRAGRGEMRMRGGRGGAGHLNPPAYSPAEYPAQHQPRRQYNDLREGDN